MVGKNCAQRGARFASAPAAGANFQIHQLNGTRRKWASPAVRAQVSNYSRAPISGVCCTYISGQCVYVMHYAYIHNIIRSISNNLDEFLFVDSVLCEEREMPLSS